MADPRDEIAQSMMAQGTGGLTPQDFATFSAKLNNPEALQGWLNAGGIYGQQGLAPPDPDEQYFASRGQPSGSVTDVGWMNAVQPWQGGVSSGDIPGSGINRSGFIGGGSAARADPAYWGWQGPRQGYAAGSVGDLSGFNAGRGGGSRAGGTGGLTPQDFAIFSRLVSPQALQDWLNAGGVQGQFGGGMGGGAGGGGSGGGGGGGGSSGGSGQGPSGSGQGPSGGGQGPAGYSNAGYNPGDVSRGPDLGSTLSNSAFDSGINQAAVSTVGAFGPNGFGVGNTPGYSGQPGFSLGIGTMGTPGQGTPDGWGYGAQEGDTFGGAW